MGNEIYKKPGTKAKSRKSKIPIVTLDGDKNITKDLQEHELIIIAPKKKKPKPRLGPQEAPKAGRPKGGWTA